MFSALKFYGARLRQASAAELLYRLKTGANTWRSQRITRRGKLPCHLPHAVSRCAVESVQLPQFEGIVTADVVQQILDGAIFCHGYDVTTVQQWRKILGVGKNETIPQGAEGADIRTVWEPARLQHLTLLMVYLVQQGATPNRREITTFVTKELTGWLAANPFLHGVQYYSAMECGLRIPVFCYALNVLRNDLAEGEFKGLSDSIYLHAWWIERNLSLYSSLGNHTICEACGLVFAGVVFRELEPGQRWLNRGQELLRRELGRQVLEDGGPLEQSFAYHRFVLDVYWLTIDLLERNHASDCQEMRERLREAEYFINVISDAGGRFPAVGDEDGGHAIAPGIGPCRERVPQPLDGCRSFSSAGYTVMRGDAGFRLLFDHGPLGMPPLYNHGHADALSITLSCEGDEMLVDPGTYRYNGTPSYRTYFKSTRAHNTVVIDGLDQAEQVTGFIWKSPYTCSVLKNKLINGRYVIEAEHTGYNRLKSPVIHRRALWYTPQESVVLKDTFIGSGEHDFTIYFHFHPDVTISPDHEWWRIERLRGKGILWIKPLDNYRFELAKGQTDAPLGWYSPAYGQKTPSPTLWCRRQGFCTEVTFTTCICLNGNKVTESQGDYSWIPA